MSAHEFRFEAKVIEQDGKSCLVQGVRVIPHSGIAEIHYVTDDGEYGSVDMRLKDFHAAPVYKFVATKE